MSSLTSSSRPYRVPVGLWERLYVRLGGRALVIWFLLMLLMAALGSGLLESTSGLQNVFIYPLLFAAATLGWFIAVLPFHGGFSLLLGMFLGIEYLLISVGQLGDNIAEIFVAVFRLLREILFWYRSEVPPDWNAVPSMIGDFIADIGVLLGRAVNWVSSLTVTSAAFDPVGTVLVWGIGLWFVALWAGWATRKHSNPVLGILPGGIVHAFVLSYTYSNPYSLLPVMGLTLVLSALMRHFTREQSWTLRDIDFSRGLWNDVATTVTAIAIVLIVLAAISPSITYERIANWVDDITRRNTPSSEVVTQSLGLDQKPQPVGGRPVDLAETTSLPNRHLIGSGPELSRIVVMTVDTGEFPSIQDELLLMADVPRYYWRSLTYDRYLGRGWSTSYTEISKYQAGEVFTDAEVDHTRILRQHVTSIGDAAQGLVHVTGQLIALDEDYEVSVRWPQEMFAATTEASEYRADSLVPVFTEEQLREASLEYPVWILERYLQLPETTPERVLVLARDLTATEPTAYDRALAIESYLRTFPYTLDVDTPTLSQDIADYFLFELREGYCDYYATSMVVLARAAGLPARLVIGYASGSYDAMNARYIVTEADAHAWVEVYFPEYGWVEFEPTGGYPELNRSNEEAPIEWPEGYDPITPLVDPVDRATQRIVIGQWLLMSVLGMVGLGILITIVDVAYLATRATPQLLRLLRKRMLSYDHSLLLHLGTSSTPDELTQGYTVRVNDLAMSMDNLDAWFMKAIDIVSNINAVYIRVWYSNCGELSSKERWHLAWQWWLLRWRLWMAMWAYRRRMERAPMPEQREHVPKSYVHPQRPAV